MNNFIKRNVKYPKLDMEHDVDDICCYCYKENCNEGTISLDSKFQQLEIKEIIKTKSINYPVTNKKILCVDFLNIAKLIVKLSYPTYTQYYYSIKRFIDEAFYQ